jgi:hypothetical protein
MRQMLWIAVLFVVLLVLVCNSPASEVPKTPGFDPQPVTNTTPNAAKRWNQWTKTP